MAKKTETGACCTPSGGMQGCCRIESVVSVDERGQMVLPKDIRDKAGIRAGDKLAVVLMEKGQEVCCISLIKVESMAEMVRDMLGPVMEDIVKGAKGEA